MASDHERLDQVPTHPLISRYCADSAGRLAIIRELFDGAARYYDPLNRWFSLGTGARYRRTCLRRAGLRPGHRLLDVAVATGLLACEALAITGDRNAVFGVDISEKMLAVARRKLGIPLAQPPKRCRSPTGRRIS